MPPKKPEEAPKGPDETEVRQKALIAATFANVELATTKQTLDQYVQLYNTARDENTKLQTELTERDKDAMNVVEFLRKELGKRQEQLKEQQKAAEDDMAAAKKNFEEERTAHKDEVAAKEHEVLEWKDKCDGLQADLDALEAFRRERHEMHIELQRFKEMQKEQTQHYETEISRLRFLSLDEKVKLKAEERDMTDRFEKAIDQRAMSLLDEKTREIHNDNHTLMRDKIMLEQELAALSKQHAEQSGHLSDKRRDIDLAKLGDDEHIKRNVKLQRENRELSQKTKTLELHLKRVVEDYEAQLQQLRSEANTTINKLTFERNQSYKDGEAKHKELVKVRALSRTIVRQRSDLETFFNEALDYVRAQIAADRSEMLMLQSKGAAAKQPLPITMGPAGGGGAGGGAPNGEGSKVRKQPVAGSAGAGAPGQPNPTHAFFRGGENFENLLNASNPDDMDGMRGGTGSSQFTGSLPPLYNQNPTAQQQQQQQQRVATGNSSASAPKPPSQGMMVGRDVPLSSVDIAQLSWVDKERVLRILFSKINATANQSVQQQQPQQLTGSSSGAGLRKTPPSYVLPAKPSSAAIEDRPDRNSMFVTQQNQ